MDPFNQVYADAEAQLTLAEELLAKYEAAPSTNHLADFNNSAQELTETIHDLSQSIGAVQRKPQQFGLVQQEIDDRIAKVAHLNNKLSDLQQAIPRARASTKPTTSTWNVDDDDIEATAGHGGPNAGASSLMYQDMIDEQDTVLDGVYTTVNSLREQANVMSRELEDQSYLIEDFDRQVETAGDKLRRGMKKVDWVLRNNRETLSSCCITLLILVLIILLVLVIIV